MDTKEGFFNKLEKSSRSTEKSEILETNIRWLKYLKIVEAVPGALKNI